MKRIIVLSIWLFATTASFAGSPIGIKGGFNGSSMVSDLPSEFKGRMKLSYHVGLFTEIDLGSGFELQPELVYSRQGDRYRNIDFDTDLNAEISSTLNYLNIPIVVKYRVWREFSVLLGPQLGVNINSNEIDIETNIGGVTQNNIYEIGDLLRACDLSLVVGLEYTVLPYMDITARYNYGVTYALESDFDLVRMSTMAKNSVIQLGVAIRIF